MVQKKRTETPPIYSGCLGRPRAGDKSSSPEESLEVELVDPSEEIMRFQRKIREIAIGALEGMLARGRFRDFYRETNTAIKKGWITPKDEDAILRKAGLSH